MKILFFDSSIEKVLNNFETEIFAKVLRTIDLLEKFGWALRMPHSKKINKDLFELRVYSNPKIRIFYTFYDGDVILLHIFTKKTQRIPTKELQVAVKRLKQMSN